jgi:hypothetical protein
MNSIHREVGQSFYSADLYKFITDYSTDNILSKYVFDEASTLLDWRHSGKPPNSIVKPVVGILYETT